MISFHFISISFLLLFHIISKITEYEYKYTEYEYKYIEYECKLYH